MRELMSLMRLLVDGVEQLVQGQRRSGEDSKGDLPE